MKKLLGLILFFPLLSFISQSKDGLAFKVYLKPGLTYNGTLMQKSHSEVIYKGDQNFLDKLKSKEIANPTITDTESEMQSLSKTGKVIADKYRFTLEIVNTRSSDGKKDIPDGTKIFGQVAVGVFQPIFDSVSSEGLTEEVKKQFMQSMQKTFSQITFPDKKLKVGDEFKKETPLSIPAAGITVSMTITTTYKLNKVSKDSALFDISQVYIMQTDVSGHVISATGDGKGNIIYDINNNFYLRYSIATNIDMKLKLDNFDLEIKSNNDFVQTTKITAE